MDITLFERTVIILYTLSASCVCISNERILDQLNVIENRLNEENRLRRTDTTYILSKLDEMEARFQKAIVGQISTIANDETLEKDKLLSERMEHQNRDSTPGDEVLLRAFREEKLVNSRTRRQVQTLVSTVTKLESEREDMKAVIEEMFTTLSTFKTEIILVISLNNINVRVQSIAEKNSSLESEGEDVKAVIVELFTTLKTFKTEMTLGHSELKSSLNNLNVHVRSIAEKNSNLEDIITKVNTTVSHLKSTTLEVLPAVQKVSEDTNALVENVSAAVATNNEKIQNVETSISVLSEHSRDQCNTTGMGDLLSKVNYIYKENLPYSSCTESEGQKNGMYRVKPNFLESAIKVYCDMDEGGWTVFQRRKDGSVDFFRNWEDYRNGFGDVRGEFWMGNELLHEFTNSRPTELRIDLVDKDGNKGYARYSSFNIGSEHEGYTLSISGYSGDVGDSLAYHNNMKFTTRDRDNDLSSFNCAVTRTGAWWYDSCNQSNLNGAYLPGVFSGKAVVWFYWHDTVESMLFTEMKLRWKS